MKAHLLHVALHRVPGLLLIGLLATAANAPPGALRSGPQVGARVTPFTSNLVTGPYRGPQRCYLCVINQAPAIVVFARHRDEPTARLLRHLRDMARESRKSKLFAWLVFLGPSGASSETALERASYDFARSNGASSVTVSTLKNPDGPSDYRISPDAVMTLIAFRRSKVLFNRAYRDGEWNAHAADTALQDLPRRAEVALTQ